MARTKRKGQFANLTARAIPKGRQVDPVALEEVRALLGDAPRRRDLLIEHLHRIQDAYGHLSAARLNALAAEMHLAQAEVFEVATFYHHFDVIREGEAAPPALTVRVCDSISCALAGGGALLEELKGSLSGDVRVIHAPCVGRCAGAPVAVVGRNPVDRATAATVEARVGAAAVEPELPEYIEYVSYRDAGGYRTLMELVTGLRTADSAMEAVDQAGLAGLGGAGFPSARKWKFVRAEPKPRLMALNADEGEPGTFKDRYFLETDPHRVLEGMLIAATIVEADAVFFYLRDEYAACRAILEKEIAALVADPPCALPEIHLRRGAGAYICGEESALIESVEGKRGEPRLRPPFPAQRGIFQRPTLVHNVETVFWLRDILERGPEMFASQGSTEHRGMRAFSISGRVRTPGVYIAPNGVTVRQLIETAGGMLDGHSFYGYLPGGASGGILPESLGDVPLDFGSLAEHGAFIGSAAVVIFSDQDRARDVALNLMRFFADESCGKCTPCRSGTDKAVRLLQEEEWDTELLKELSAAMMDASICGLGQAAPNPVLSVMRFFPHELENGR